MAVKHRRSFLKRILAYQVLITGINWSVLPRSVANFPAFVRDYRKYKQLNKRPSFDIKFNHLFPLLNDRTAAAGSIGWDYFHQDLWAARKIFQRRPSKHLDIGSSIDSFAAHLLVFMDVAVIDIRPLQSTVKGLTFVQDDATTLTNFPDDSIDSLSTLNVAEHFGLGRYGDPVDPEACFTYMKSLQRVLAPGGVLYFAVPAGVEHVQFNANRVFDVATILREFGGLNLVSFSYVGKDGKLYEEANPFEPTPDLYSTALFEFTKQA